MATASHKSKSGANATNSTVNTAIEREARNETKTRSPMERMAEVLSAPSSALPPAKDTQTVPGHIANILKVILLHDKFDQNFEKWNLLLEDDRDILVLTLKNGAQVDSVLVYTICMMYPFRIHGPLVIKNTMHVEFLHENRLDSVVVTHDIAPKNIEYILGTCMHKRKRQRLQHHDPVLTDTTLLEVDSMKQMTNTKTADASSSDLSTTSGPPPHKPPVCDIPKLNLDLIRHKLSTSLQSTNNSRVFVNYLTTGFDAGGSWVTFQLSECDKLNLDFMGSFQLSIDDMPIKVTSSKIMNLRIERPPH